MGPRGWIVGDAEAAGAGCRGAVGEELVVAFAGARFWGEGGCAGPALRIGRPARFSRASCCRVLPSLSAIRCHHVFLSFGLCGASIKEPTPAPPLVPKLALKCVVLCG